jgi:hypothetical protein
MICSFPSSTWIPPKDQTDFTVADACQRKTGSVGAEKTSVQRTFVQRMQDDRSSPSGLFSASLGREESYRMSTLEKESLAAEPQSAANHKIGGSMGRRAELLANRIE